MLLCNVGKTKSCERQSIQEGEVILFALSDDLGRQI